MSDQAPMLTPLRKFLRDVARSYMWFRDNRDNPKCDPPLPKLIKQGRNNFVLTTDVERYKRELLRKSGIPVAGRPRKGAPPDPKVREL